MLRKLSQDVPAFRAYVEAAAGANGSSPQEIAAKMVGRWQDGRSLVTSGIPNVPDDDPALDPDRINRFRYRSFRGNDIDPDGVRFRSARTCAAPTHAIRWGLKECWPSATASSGGGCRTGIRSPMEAKTERIAA